MIKSKSSPSQQRVKYIMLGLVLLYIFLIWLAFFSGWVPPGRRPRMVVAAINLNLILLLLLAQLRLFFRTVTIDPVARQIEITTFFKPFSTAHSFDDFDGYVAMTIQTKKSSYPAIYLVQGKRLRYKMSAQYYGNLDEIKEGLAGMTYLGFMDYSFWRSIKIGFGGDAYKEGAAKL